MGRILRGVSYRVMTAGVIGADIGAGLVILALPVAVVGLLASAVTAWLVRVRGTGAQAPGQGSAC